MNALLDVMSNAAGLRNTTPAKRAEAAQQISANARAQFLGLVKARIAEITGNAQAAARAASTQTANNTKSAANAKAAAAATTSASSAAAKSTSSTDSSSTRNVGNTLDQNMFLQLLVTQLQNQDPMSPTDNTQMVAQLAQFSSLEQMNNLNASFEELQSVIQQQNFLSAGDLVGHTISGKDTTGTLQTGKVERVYIDSGSVYLVVNNNAIAMDKVQNIE